MNASGGSPFEWGLWSQTHIPSKLYWYSYKLSHPYNITSSTCYLKKKKMLLYKTLRTTSEKIMELYICWNIISPCTGPGYESPPQVAGGVVFTCDVSSGGSEAVGWKGEGCWYILEDSGVEWVLLVDSSSTRGIYPSSVAGLFTPTCCIKKT